MNQFTGNHHADRLSSTPPLASRVASASELAPPSHSARAVALGLIRTYLSDLRLTKTWKALKSELATVESIESREADPDSVNFLKRAEVEYCLGVGKNKVSGGPYLETIVDMWRSGSAMPGGGGGKSPARSRSNLTAAADTKSSATGVRRMRKATEEEPAAMRVDRLAQLSVVSKPLATRLSGASSRALAAAKPLLDRSLPEVTTIASSRSLPSAISRETIGKPDLSGFHSLGTAATRYATTGPPIAVPKQQHSRPAAPPSCPAVHQMQDLELTDHISDFDEDYDDVDHSIKSVSHAKLFGNPALPSTNAAALPTDEAQYLHTLIWGSQKPTSAWLTARLERNTAPGLGYGLMQHKGGPCGLLAALQARLLMCLLRDAGPKDGWVRTDFEAALPRAVAECLWAAAGDNQTAVVAIPSTHSAPSSGPPQLTRHLLPSLSSLVAFIARHLSNLALLPILYSLILTRTQALVRADMDDASTPLIAAHGYCTQELVNLALIGVAASNVFDGVKTMDEQILKGVECATTDIGFLSLFEAFGVLEVGERYKQPRYPVWVIHADSHYTVLFAPRLDAIDARRFELWYYDGLANQDAEVVLRVTPGKNVVDEESRSELIPPIERCIRTLWRGAHVQWVNCEPIL
ncbi:hypothetical protein HDU87_005278 [Geranomyces variabilis]|uniref:Deubiquitinating enzyme MINDY-3/4 conserved domain-containing protein n=1 Tax=Geranomyces variabilis TaxID=109894 RepID=A0AAD5XLB6_9FUNG|nr:hypothetical protein HDU87_005278 [Geranomyces variabilis]